MSLGTNLREGCLSSQILPISFPLMPFQVVEKMSKRPNVTGILLTLSVQFCRGFSLFAGYVATSVADIVLEPDDQDDNLYDDHHDDHHDKHHDGLHDDHDDEHHNEHKDDHNDDLYNEHDYYHDVLMLFHHGIRPNDVNDDMFSPLRTSWHTA